jgi:hypothetical protein
MILFAVSKSLILTLASSFWGGYTGLVVRILAGSCHTVKLARIVIAKYRIDAVFFFLRPLSGESWGEEGG